MTGALFVPLPGNEQLATDLAKLLGGEVGEFETRRFPDQETYLRFRTDPTGRSVVLVCSLDRPDAKILPLLFAADAARDLGASQVGLAAPYLAYMRQDKRFQRGEALTSASFARLLSREFPWLATVDPHLHRYASLAEIYSIPTGVAHAAPLLSDWIRSNVSDPLVVGPDSESKQWVEAVASGSAAPYIVLEKRRYGDRQVEISIPHLERWPGRTPVLVDDVISSGRTMVEACRRMRAAGTPAPVCLAVHALFAEDAFQRLNEVASRIVTTNTVPHESNAIDVAGSLAREVARFTAIAAASPEGTGQP